MRIQRFGEFVYEGLVARDKKDEIFNYRQLANRAWAPIIKKGQEFYKINFDLENDEVAEKKTLFVEKNLRKDQPVKYEFNCVYGPVIRVSEA